ncbi:GTP pyrophosphokinase family protein [Oceanobacillus sp. CFH 90083]|uniref:GTP pyrophosphokinase n=1 Tax=Oceanobacillus sp. CFH 90083 TaxID=2592336 RepID=UPI00128B895C|nr:GTP pyrophosphokinase family protein [Oceanobacillus sp. CFH 90083]
MDWGKTLAPYKQAVEELKVKLKGIRSEYQREFSNSPIEFVTGRVKPIPSIIEKARERQIPLENLDKLQDIAGIRVVCQFVDDIYPIVEMLRKRNDFQIIEEKDYVFHKKDSGYRSYHMIIEYPVETVTGRLIVLAEVQIRTLAMNFWATNEHSLNYKYDGNLPSEVKLRLQKAAEAAFKLDEEMSKIRSEIHEAQRVFHRKS